MSQQQSIEFVLSGTVAGKIISARQGVPFSRFVDFNEDVQKYVQGSDAKTVLSDLQVQIDESSYLLRLLISAGVLTSLISDTAKVAQSGSLADIDRKRAEVMLRWQERAKTEPTLIYEVRSPSGTFAPVKITQTSDYRREEKEQWVDVERYLMGQILDWGGAQNVNIHLRLRNSKESAIIDAKESQIREQRENLVFHRAIVRVRAKENLRTGELKDYKLIELRAYGEQVEESKLQSLFERGAKAWADIPDAGKWVEGLRGGADA
jgi:hypothetical protein